MANKQIRQAMQISDANDLNEKRSACQVDDEMRKENRESRRAHEMETPTIDKETALLHAILDHLREADVTSIQAIGVLSVAATLMTSQSYDLSMRDDDVNK